MIRSILIDKHFLNIPVRPGVDETTVHFYTVEQSEAGEQLVQRFELALPIDQEENGEYNCDFYGQIPMDEFQGKVMHICGFMPDTFAKAIHTSDDMAALMVKGQAKPAVHMAADSGWTNDPNGLVYDNGVYHLYYQYNPFNKIWNNMTWGHATSTDLIHWTQHDSVLFPDQYGTMFSGCAIKNDRELLGLPKDALLFFYTVAGGLVEWSKRQKFMQKLAYSLDGGKTLVKVEEPVVPFLYEDSRDPKVFWHEETQAYIMVLWLKKFDFAILRSTDLKNWEISDELTLENGWECPDLFELTAADGKKRWFFWSADGFYYRGEFDGYHFKTDGKKHLAYMTKVPYAAQTYSGVAGNRVISVPWLRLKEDERAFVGAYGIPTELSWKDTEDGPVITQMPVEELMRCAVDKTMYVKDAQTDHIYHSVDGLGKAIVMALDFYKKDGEEIWFRINETEFFYNINEGTLKTEDKVYNLTPGLSNLFLIVDDKILEIFFGFGVSAGTFELKGHEAKVEFVSDTVRNYQVYEVE